MTDKDVFLKAISDQPYLKKAIVEQFHKLYYYSSAVRGTWKNTTWRGQTVYKCPLDMWVYQELIHEIQPDIIIETGTFHGGSALYFADMCDLEKRGHVFSIDVNHDFRMLPTHDRLTYITGSSTSHKVVNILETEIKEEDKVLVILDSDHTANHVLNELEIYSRFVTTGSFLIVEDGNINGHPVAPEHGPGPMEAVDGFLKICDDFVVDLGKEKFFMTFAPRGFLRKIK